MELAEQQLTSLVNRARSGDKDAFGEIVAQYQGLVSSVTYSLIGDVDRSQDVAQDTFIAAWKQLRELRDLQKLPAWLCGIARNLARNSRRAKMRDPLAYADEVSTEHALQQESVAERLSHAERETILWQTLATIPEEYREPLVLYYREGHSVRAVAEALDISEESARQRLSRGRKMLKEQVAGIVEDTLRITRPGSAFTLAVLGALPLAVGQTAAAAGVVATGTASATKAASAGAATAVPAATVAGIAGGLVGGLAGGLLGARTIQRVLFEPIRDSSSLRARRFGLKMRAAMHAVVWLFFGYLATTALVVVHFFRKTPSLQIGAVSAWALGFVLYLAGFITLVVWARRVARRIIEEDADAPKAPLEDSSLSLASVRRACNASLVLSGLCSAPVVVGLAHLWSWPLLAVYTLFILLWHGVILIGFRKELAVIASAANRSANG